MNNICPLTLLVQILHIVGGIDLDEEQMRAVVDMCINAVHWPVQCSSVVCSKPPAGFHK